MTSGGANRMRPSGRPPAPANRPESAVETFGWLCRLLRDLSTDQEIQQTPHFTKQLSSFLPRPITTATVNRMETGVAHFDIARIAGYEQVLGIDQGVLLDIYLYLSRLSAAPGQTVFNKSSGMSSGEFYDIAHLISSGYRVTPYQWLMFTTEIAHGEQGSILESRRYRTAIIETLITDFGRSFESDERLLREAVINLAAQCIPQIVERVGDEPITLFNIVEALGFVSHRAAWDALLRMGNDIDDGVRAQTLIEPIRRWVRHDNLCIADLRDNAPGFLRYCEDVTIDSMEAFTTREEALLFLKVLQQPPSRKFRGYMQQNGSELQQLLVRLVGITQVEVVDSLTQEVNSSRIVRGILGRNGATARPIGFEHILGRALFSPERVHRLGLALALGPLRIAPDICGAAGNFLLSGAGRENPGLQRSLIRFMTKINNEAAHPYFSKFASTKIDDDGVRLSLAWALGTSTGVDDAAHLRNLVSGSSPTTRRVIALSAGRREFYGLLAELLNDPHSEVSAEAQRLLRDRPVVITAASARPSARPAERTKDSTKMEPEKRLP